MKKIINRLINYETLSKAEAKKIIKNIADGKYNQSQISSFLTIFMMRNIKLEELEGFREALLELCVKINLSEFDTIDLCGTGGDGKDTFNISTLSSFVCSGAGLKVSKHGNYGVSSGCGSSNVLEFLGIKFTNNQDFLLHSIDKAGICFIHAPLFHPAMKNVANIRRELGVKTFFNMLGPLVNPSFPNSQFTGVFNLELARLYGYLLEKTNKKYSVVYSLDGYDEISLTSPVKLITNNNERILNPNDFSLEKLKNIDIIGGESISSSAKIFMNVLNNKSNEAQKSVVLANAGMAISTALNINIKNGIEKAKESLNSGKALESFKKLKKISSK